MKKAFFVGVLLAIANNSFGASPLLKAYRLGEGLTVEEQRIELSNWIVGARTHITSMNRDLRAIDRQIEILVMPLSPLHIYNPELNARLKVLTKKRDDLQAGIQYWVQILQDFLRRHNSLNANERNDGYPLRR